MMDSGSLSQPIVYIIIATAFRRTEQLLERSLRSVYNQNGIDGRNIKIIIVDDNENENEYAKIIDGVAAIRRALNPGESAFLTRIVRNQLTRFKSGTGAWNTGIYMAYNENPDGFISILDDDDEYLPTHLADCLNQVKQDPDLEAVFQELEWKFPDGKIWSFHMDMKDITPEAFYISDPGIQGSNLFVKTKTLVKCGSFDETFESATDRDLMIRLIWLWMKEGKEQWQNKFKLLQNTGVIHHIHDRERVTTNKEKKWKGLTRFFEKYKFHFSEAAFQKSFKRAAKHFLFPVMHSDKGSIVVLMTMRNNESTVERAIHSVLNQKAISRQLLLLISDDASVDESVARAELIANEFSNVLIFKNHFNSAAKNRNWLQNYVKDHFPECILIGRLDADDTLAEEDILQKIEKLWDEKSFDVLMMANHQVKNNEFTGFTNQPTESLKDFQSLLDRLKQMAEGNWEAELPSCNLFVRPQAAIPFQEEESAEDHRNVVDYLFRSGEFDIVVRPEWVYANYHIDKHQNANSFEKAKRLRARKQLYHFAKNHSSEIKRQSDARRLLEGFQPGGYKFLGKGASGVVFHDGKWVLKVYLSLPFQKGTEVDNLLFLKSKLTHFQNRKHFYPVKELTLVKNVYVLIYPFETSEKVTGLSRQEMVSLLAEMRQLNLVCQSITKKENLIRVNGTIKMIDFEVEPYHDNLFLNVAARSFIQLNEFKHQSVSLNKLKRSVINNYQLPELDGFYNFVEEIFLEFAKNQYPAFSDLSVSKPFSIPAILTKTGYDGKQNPSVCLLIKACVQDSAWLYHDVNYLVTALTSHVQFLQIGLLLDIYKESDFLRQYTSLGNKTELIANAERLVKENIITQLVIPPDTDEEIRQINLKWFGHAEPMTHSVEGVPVTSQLYAFEQMPGDYVLQMDVDILIGHQTYHGDYLKEMISALKEHPNAFCFGFQIFQGENFKIQPIQGKDGLIPPDVRCSLIDKKRLLELRPIPNNPLPNGWELTWYRALENYQKVKGYISLRGGRAETFYIHIQNFRKVNRWVWHTTRKGVAHHFIPEFQIGKPEVTGDIFSWCLPKREEELVVIVYLDEQDRLSLHQTVTSLVGQDLKGFGLVLINNTGNQNFLDEFQALNPNVQNWVTIITSEQPIPYNEAIYKAVHYYLPNPDSFILLMQQGDILLYPEVLFNCLSQIKTYEADVLVGKEISERTVFQAGRSQINFCHPRDNSGDLLNGLIFFRKYLFDGLSQHDMKEKVIGAAAHIPELSNIGLTHRWLDDKTMLSLLAPIIELSQNPIRFDHFNVLRIKPVSNELINAATHFLHQQPPKEEGAFELGRKKFTPNQKKIEIDITYDCNLNCFHCNRSCTQAPTRDGMTLDQIQKFIDESIELNKKWQLINLLGGEPTLHPEFDEIVNLLLYAYIIPHSPQTTLQITSNGYGEAVRQKLNKLPDHPNVVVDYNSFKKERLIPYFTPFNLAPIDETGSHLNDYRKGCWVTSYCGIGLNHLGYFACSVAGGIERILNAGKGIDSQGNFNDHLLEQQLNTYCRLCGNFTAYDANRGDFMERAEKDCVAKNEMSISWKNLYQKYNRDHK